MFTYQLLTNQKLTYPLRTYQIFTYRLLIYQLLTYQFHITDPNLLMKTLISKECKYFVYQQ